MSVAPIVWVRTLLAIGMLYLLSLVMPVFLPVILAVVFSFILNPLVNFFVSLPNRVGRRSMARPIAILIAFVVSALGFTMAIAFILLPFIREFDKFVLNLPDLFNRLQNISLIIEQRASALSLPDSIQAVVDQGIARAASFSVEMARGILDGLLGFASQVVELIVVPVLTYYFLKDWPELKENTLLLFPVERRNKVRVVVEEMGTVVSGYIRGQVLVSILVGLIVFIGMYFLNIDYPLVLGLLAALTETIPIVGPIIGAVPAILLAYLVAPALAVKVVIFYIIIQQVENHVIVPKVMGHTIELHPTVVIISLLIGGHLYGIVGMMLAVPIAALLRVLGKHLWYYGER